MYQVLFLILIFFSYGNFCATSIVLFLQLLLTFIKTFFMFINQNSYLYKVSMPAFLLFAIRTAWSGNLDNVIREAKNFHPRSITSFAV